MSFDINSFPTSETAKRAMGRVSPVYDKSYVAKWLFQIMGLENDETIRYFGELRLQAFPEAATWGLRYWEQRYGITPDESVPIDIRRNNVIIKRNMRLPMNPARMEQILSEACGREVFIHENTGDYKFSIVVAAGDNTVDYAQLSQIIRKKKPSHQRFDISTNEPATGNVYYGFNITEYRTEEIS